MRLPDAEHTSRPWRIHELTRDFRLEDVWALPTPGGSGDFPRLVQQIAAGDTSTNASRAARALFAIRWKVGELLGWDDPNAGHGSQRPTLRDRLPGDLREAPGPDFATLPFTSLYLLGDDHLERAGEVGEARPAWARAINLAPDGSQRAGLSRRIPAAS